MPAIVELIFVVLLILAGSTATVWLLRRDSPPRYIYTSEDSNDNINAETFDTLDKALSRAFVDIERPGPQPVSITCVQPNIVTNVGTHSNLRLKTGSILSIYNDTHPPDTAHM